MENERPSRVIYKTTEPTERDLELWQEAKRRAREAHQQEGRSCTSPFADLEFEYVPEEEEDNEETEEFTKGGVDVPAPQSAVSLEQSSFLELIPPPNFSLVTRGVYRSSFPKIPNFAFLKLIGIKSILTLVPEMYPEANEKFVRENSIRHFHVGMPGNKEPFVNITEERMTAALKIVLNRRNQPLLIHCNKGKHRTGCVVGCFRKIQSWSLVKTLEEYRSFAEPKSRNMDEHFIDLFDERPLVPVARRRGFVIGCGSQHHSA
ncbi:MAG: hypothetical protein M1814_006252 [Vezdaea aestivalis]|nr:MAG: hypothetical protein M1814_006252 [Vezdaea aestivalis]